MRDFNPVNSKFMQEISHDFTSDALVWPFSTWLDVIFHSEREREREKEESGGWGELECCYRCIEGFIGGGLMLSLDLISAEERICFFGLKVRGGAGGAHCCSQDVEVRLRECLSPC